MITRLIGTNRAELRLTRACDTMLISTDGPVVLNARGLRALRDLAHRERLPENAIAPETNRVALAQGLRAMADWIEAAPEWLVPAAIEAGVYPRDTIENVREAARAMAPASKEMDETYLRLHRDFGGHVRLCAVFFRKTVCVPRVVGQKAIPATEAVFLPAQPERMVDVIEWDCAPIFGEHDPAEPAAVDGDDPPGI